MRRILDIFYQDGEPDVGIPSHWCVQYRDNNNSFVDYKYFKSLTEAREYAMGFGYED